MKQLLHRLYLQGGAPTLDEIRAAAQAHGTAAVAGWPGRDSSAASSPRRTSRPRDPAPSPLVAALAAGFDAAHRARELWVQANSWTPPGTALQEISDQAGIHVGYVRALARCSLGCGSCAG
ncbi:hypothetical protein GCM10009527_082840 [Actinomadura nitritigenes]